MLMFICTGLNFLNHGTRAQLGSVRDNPQHKAARQANSARSKSSVSAVSAAVLTAVVACVSISGCGGLVTNNSKKSSPAAAGTFSVTPTSVDFGTVTVGTSATSAISLVNQSSAPVVISELAFSPNSFSVDGNTRLPLTLSA